MKDILSKVLIFTVGAAVGSAVTWKLVKTRYERIANEEIASVKAAFSTKRVEPTEPEEPKDEMINDVNRDYADIIKSSGYSEEVKDVGTKPYVIPPETFGDIEEYEQVSLTYYSDGVLADDRNYPVENVDDVVGKDSLTHFGEYEEDSVFVRNEQLETDYEILLDQRNYSDVVSINSHSTEDE